MPSPTTARGLLGIFSRGANPPVTNPCATTAPVQLPTCLSLWAILAAGSGGRSARGGGSGRRDPREEGGRRAGEGGWKGEGTGRPQGEAETGRRKTIAQGRTMAETERRIWAKNPR